MYIERLACSLGRSDEEPNIDLAVLLCESKDKNGFDEIVNGLNNNNKAVASDCIKVLYEAGSRNPELLAPYAMDLLPLLNSTNNRLIWGGMTALAYIADLAAEVLFDNIDIILKAYKAGSVITVDNSISVFAAICAADETYSKKVFPIILAHLETCRPKEIPQHAERASICVNKGNLLSFAGVLERRMSELTTLQAARVKKLLAFLNKNL